MQYWRSGCGELQRQPFGADLHPAIKAKVHHPRFVSQRCRIERIRTSNRERGGWWHKELRTDINLRTNLGTLHILE